MSFFLKQTKIKNRIFLQISETTYNSNTKKSSNKCYKKIGFLDEVILKGIQDPITYYKNEVQELNKKRAKIIEQEKQLKIKDRKEIRTGYFLFKVLLKQINFKQNFNIYFDLQSNQQNYFNLIETLIYCKIIYNQATDKNFYNCVNYLYNVENPNEEDIFNTLEFIGKNYEKIIDIFNKSIQNVFPSKRNVVFFDSFKSFYNNDCITQSIFMDEDVIPVSIKISNSRFKKFNLSEELKTLQKKFSTEKIIHVADRGINYGNNLYNSIIHKNGYIFPLSLSSVINDDKEWILNDEGYEKVLNESGDLLYKLKDNIKKYYIKVVKNDGSLTLFKTKQKRVAVFNQNLSKKKMLEINKLVEQTKVLYFSNAQKHEYSKALKYIKILKEEGKEDKIVINTEKIENEIKNAGYKLLVTSEENIEKNEIFYISEIVWKIEDYFRTQKNQIDNNFNIADNLYRIYGCLVINYIVIVLYRILEKKVFKSAFTPEEIIRLCKGMKFLRIQDIFINLTNPSKIVEETEKLYNLSLTNLYIKKRKFDDFLTRFS